jgi:PTS system ascorbate-specific IIB component
MTILAVCGNGLGSSLMLSINVGKVMKKLGLDGVCKNLDLASAKTESADYYIGSPEIMEQLADGKRKTISLVSIVSLNEIESALKKHIAGLEEKNV